MRCLLWIPLAFVLACQPSVSDSGKSPDSGSSAYHPAAWSDPGNHGGEWHVYEGW